jgi:hypothetical protein
VENRFVGMKSRGIYETPGGTILLEAHRGIEQITLDSGRGHLKDSIMPRYAELIYNGFWFSPEREMLQALIDKAQEHVSGTVRVKLYKGSARTVARWSDHSLYSEAHVTFEEDAGAYDQKDAQGFIQLNALRLKLLAARNRRRRPRNALTCRRNARFSISSSSRSSATSARISSSSASPARNVTRSSTAPVTVERRVTTCTPSDRTSAGNSTLTRVAPSPCTSRPAAITRPSWTASIPVSSGA